MKKQLDYMNTMAQWMQGATIKVLQCWDRGPATPMPTAASQPPKAPTPGPTASPTAVSNSELVKEAEKMILTQAHCWRVHPQTKIECLATVTRLKQLLASTHTMTHQLQRATIIALQCWDMVQTTPVPCHTAPKWSIWRSCGPTPSPSPLRHRHHRRRRRGCMLATAMAAEMLRPTPPLLTLLPCRRRPCCTFFLYGLAAPTTATCWQRRQLPCRVPAGLCRPVAERVQSALCSNCCFLVHSGHCIVSRSRGWHWAGGSN
jgi:hypothetical protein